MIRKFLVLFTLFFFLGLFFSCTRKVREDEKALQNSGSETVRRTEEAAPPPGGKRLGQQKVRGTGRGLGLKALMSGRGRGWSEGEAIVLSDEEKEAITIETAKAIYRDMSSHLQVMGKVLAHPFRKAIVSYAFPARVSRIQVKLGDWVKTGQELVTLQSEEVGEAKSAFYKAIADHELARSNYEREKRLFDRGVGAQKNLLATEAELKVAEANLDAAEKKLHVLGFTEAQVKDIAQSHQINPVVNLFSPISGKIIEINAVLGGMIDQSTEILTVMDPSVLCIDAEIYERDIAKIRVGLKVEATVPAYPDNTFSGKICYISDVLKEETRTITVRTEVENREYELKAGMFANIKIFLNKVSRAIVVPEEAVLDDKGESLVFLAKNGRYYPQLVNIGNKEDGFVEILSGVRENDEVVAKGSYQLKSKLYDEILKRAGIH